MDVDFDLNSNEHAFGAPEAISPVLTDLVCAD